MFKNLNQNKSLVLASYPKSGNTWLRFIFSHLFTKSDTEINFNTIEKLAPGIMQPWKLWFHKRMLNPPVFKSHSNYHSGNRSYKNIYIIRDPRDVYISYYYFLGGAKDLEHFPWFISNYEFPYGRWSEHVRSWLKHKDESHVAIIQYENLLENTIKELNKVFLKLSLPSSEKQREHAIKNSTFNTLKRNEKKSGNDYFFRKGKSQEWMYSYSNKAKEVFCMNEDVKLIEEIGYPPFD